MMFHTQLLPGASDRRGWVKAALLLVALVSLGRPGACLPAFAQPPVDGFASWKEVELSPQFKEVVAGLKSDGAFNDAARDFVTSVILPQFDKAENLPTLDDVRKKIRDRFLLAIGSEAAFTEAGSFVRDRLAGIARDPQADLLQRVNAMMFIGEMTDKGRMPWQPAVETLVAAARDPDLDPAVRIAAIAGINNHLAGMTRMTADQAAAIRATVAATLPDLLPAAAADPQEKTPPRPPSASWLVTRGLGMLPQVMNPVSPEIASRLVAVIDDASWPLDVRVRAVAALGKTVGAESSVNAPAVMASIRNLAIEALDADRREGKRLIELQSFKAGAGAAGGPRGPMRGAMPGMGPDMMGVDGAQAAEDGLSMAVCRRAAWRLYTLGDAILPDTKKGGFAALLDQDADAAQRLAMLLKEIGETLDAEPYGSVLLKGLDDLDPAGAKKRAGLAAPADAPQQPADGGPAAPGPDKPAPKPTDSPFGDSPF
jgi:hypothetical protein